MKLVLIALLAANAFAGKAARQLGLEESGTKPDAAKFARTDPAKCAKDASCWRLVTIGFKELLPAHTRTIDAALPGFFFKGCVTFVLAGVNEADGHFIYVRCEDPKNKKRRPDARLRDKLEQRVVMATLVAALPLGLPAEERYTERYELTGEGAAAFAAAQAGRPNLWPELVALTREALGVSDKGLPKALQ